MEWTGLPCQGQGLGSWNMPHSTLPDLHLCPAASPKQRWNIGDLAASSSSPNDFPAYSMAREASLGGQKSRD